MKVAIATETCGRHDVSFARKHVDLIEIQSDSGEVIASHKAEQAYQLIKAPIAITDDSWLIPALGGFPGPYMKYINQWLRPEDILRIMYGLTDRRIILRQIVVYQDKHGQKMFSCDIPGLLLEEARGTASIPLFSVISFDGGKHSAAEQTRDGYTSIQDHKTAWDDVCEWLKNRKDEA